MSKSASLREEARPVVEPAPSSSQAVHQRRRESGVRRAVRAHERQGISLSLWFEIAGELREGVGMNVSVGGMYVETSEPAPFGAAIRICMAMDARTKPFVIEATVRWTDERGMGVQFGLTGARETHAIAGLMVMSNKSP